MAGYFPSARQGRKIKKLCALFSVRVVQWQNVLRQYQELHPLRSLVTSVLGQFGLWSLRPFLKVWSNRGLNWPKTEAVYLLYAGTVWGVTVAGVSVADVGFHARTDAGTSVLRLTLGRTAWLKLKDQHCLSDNVNNVLKCLCLTRFDYVSK